MMQSLLNFLEVYTHSMQDYLSTLEITILLLLMIRLCFEFILVLDYRMEILLHYLILNNSFLVVPIVSVPSV